MSCGASPPMVISAFSSSRRTSRSELDCALQRARCDGAALLAVKPNSSRVMNQLRLHDVVISRLEHRIPASEEELPFANKFRVETEGAYVGQVVMEVIPALAHG